MWENVLSNVHGETDDLQLVVWSQKIIYFYEKYIPKCQTDLNNPQLFKITLFLKKYIYIFNDSILH
jgi:hypothetical protein